MERTFRVEEHLISAVGTHGWLTYDDPERKRLEQKAQQILVVEKDYQISSMATESTAVTTPIEDATSTVFEYDITGIRVRGIGQASGGYLREVAENEAALSYILQDVAGLFLLNKITESDNPINIKQLEDIIGGSDGWIRFAMLIRGGLVEIVGSEVRVTERGLNQLNAILSFCQKQENGNDCI